ncbi:MAG: outer membrane protein assembly factor BamD, partial [Lentisphaerae bacterium]|nr:outer membrane protein assembly factor BamD [Lentisphaerota bacterium]
IDVIIRDKDCDVSDKPDVIKFQVKTQTGEPIEVKAMEQSHLGRAVWEPSDHSGIFRGSIFPVKEAPQRPGEIQVAPEESLIILYQDEENTDPGVSWARQLVIPQVSSEAPQLRVYDVESNLLDARKKEQQATEIERRAQAGRISREEFIPPIRDLVATRPMRPDYGKPSSIISDGPLLVELTYPLLARTTGDEAWVYAQTLAARNKAGKTEDDDFDITVPGTVRIGAYPGDFPRIEPPPGYFSVILRGDPYASSAMFAGRFSFIIPKELGSVPNESYATVSNSLETVRRDPDLLKPLLVQGNDTIFVGFPFKDSNGSEHWVTQSVVMESDVFFDITDRYYREIIEESHVGEPLYLRVNHRGMDLTEDKDTLSLMVQTSSGVSTNITLTETFQHTGSFRGVIKPIYKDDPTLTSEDNAIPVNYGEVITMTYTPKSGEPVVSKVLIKKGADGLVLPFTKRFQDQEIAVQTQFLIAEAYFELAKKHRELNQESLARRQIDQGRKLLMEAIRDFPDSDSKAQADYLLADLALEYANDAENETIRRQNYMDAINRFSDIIALYSDSLYAPKAQYKKALAFEKMGDIDQACEEYVKLSYTYPESEYIPQTIARLGHYFAEKGRELEAKVKEAKDDRMKKRLEDETKGMYKTAAQVFGRLAPRFPTHELSGKTLVLSGQCYMRAEEFKKAVETLAEAIKVTAGADHDLTAEAMYWRADSFTKDRPADMLNAYREFRKLTWDYPASKWAKYARGRLTARDMQQFAADE